MREIERVTEWLATHPGSLPGRMAALRFGLPRSGDLREIAVAPDTRPAVLIGPANHAGQGYRWARALEASSTPIAARALAVASAFGFDADATVSRRVFQNSPSWQRRQQRAAGGFSHLLVESLIPPFGRLAGRDLHRQLALLGPGVSTAFVCHGTDVRAVRGPTESMSPRDRQADRIASRNRDLLGTFDAPVFVTTPDLIDDVPTAVWLPVVIDQDAWASGGRAESSRPRVLHVPSDSAMKGSAMIEPVVQRLHEQGVIHYQAARQIPHSRMPQMIGSADIVLDQFVLGSYGVAACEAMASGAVVVGHVTDAVRDRVRAATGRRLPIVEATAQSLHDVLSTLAHDSQQRRALADEGRAFAGDVHDGRLSADMLRREWIDTPAGRSNTLT